MSARTFILKYKRAFAGALVFSFVCFGFMLTHFTLGIDDETWILSKEQSAVWILQGRFAIWLFNLIFTDCGNFAPFLWDALAIVTWNLSGILFAYALLEKENPKGWQIFFFCAYYNSLPFVVGELMSFSMFSWQVSIAMAVCAGGFFLSRRFVEKKTKKDAVAAFFLLLYAIATFQAMICVYVTAVVAYCLVRYLRQERDALCRAALTCAAVCAASVAAYFVLNLLLGCIFGTAGYLSDNYNGWLSGDWKTAVAMAVANIARVSFAIPYKGEYIYGGSVIRVMSVLFVICSVWLFIKEKERKGKAGVLFYTVALCVAPFILYLALATYKTHGRMLPAISLAGAVQMYLIFRTLRRPLPKKAMILLSGYLLFLNARNMNLIYYYSSIVYEKDCVTAAQIMYDIQKAGMDYHQKPIAFIGMIVQDTLPVKESCTLGGSFFSWDDGNNARMEDFLQTRGYATETADGLQLADALAQAGNMQAWPREGSIAETEDVIIVYLSEPTEKWYVVNQVPGRK